MIFDKKDRILKCIVEYFIQYAEPVGSNTLIDVFKLPYSSATIRNYMVELEQAGLIEKTHTSSGRVPSSKGYRYYVDNLQVKTEVGEEFKKQFSLVLKQKTQSVEDLIAKSCEILSSMTNLATVVLGPKSNEEHLVSIQTIPLSSNTATAVFVTDQGYVENKTFVVNDGLDMELLKKAVTVLNDRLKGTPVFELNDKLESIKPILSEFMGKKNEIIFEAFAETFIQFAKERISTFGAKKLLELPEYENNSKQLKKVLELLDEPESFMKTFDYAKDSDELVSFGDEMLDDDCSNVAFVSHKIKVNNEDFGNIALLGPKRMDYQHVLATLEYVAHELSKYFEGKDEKK